MNLYDLVNEELKRLHELLRLEYQMEERRVANHAGYASSGTLLGHGVGFSNSKISYISKRIDEIEQEILNQFKGHDQKIQQKIAELALTGDQT